MTTNLEEFYGPELSRKKKIYHVGATIDIIKSIHHDFWYHHCGHLFDMLYDLPLEQVMRVHEQYKKMQEQVLKQRYARSASSIDDDGC